MNTAKGERITLLSWPDQCETQNTYKHPNQTHTCFPVLIPGNVLCSVCISPTCDRCCLCDRSPASSSPKSIDMFACASVPFHICLSHELNVTCLLFVLPPAKISSISSFPSSLCYWFHPSPSYLSVCSYVFPLPSPFSVPCLCVRMCVLFLCLCLCAWREERDRYPHTCCSPFPCSKMAGKRFLCLCVMRFNVEKWSPSCLPS